MCYPGYHFNKTVGECTDVDDCLKPDACFNDEQCLNEEGRYSCILCDATKSDDSCTIRTICPPGFEFDTQTPTRCKDIDECAIFRNICPRNKECRNVFGSYRCEESRCPPGYEMKSGSCHDIDECRLKLHACEEMQECRNIPGSYRCDDRQQCLPGFERDSSNRCTDIDECQRFGGVCQFDCINTIGSYRCSCPVGYRLSQNGKSCEDIDECKMNPLICEGFCENTIGSFECRCEPGFERKQSGECGDINECLAGEPCAPDELCFNTYSSYKCMKVNCPPGYTRHNG
ncbi:fibulin-2-like protein [Leptotrombidium deliense]|uniref:Fibulin-2-like protein n=1 Tax=Leptotrombidium deliense TaxID=299467 RepID=A0A443RZB4_9ACAR|nr:fibulin-2-like protein [Leptotrombidium deliense]